MSAIIQVTDLSKSYTISHEGRESYTALRDVMASKARKIFSFPKWMRPGEQVTKEVFWALNDINFEIRKGDRLGIIGRNGAGKSTLLKILSRITEPTKGNIKIRGRVASLLEVGTGFHPELTGRENIYLNGAILGMSRNEIKKKFDEIVEFAEVEKFLDTPVKRYSSGMYVRLAFAVAAHLEPEILIVDEVLAVGDAQFQKKCLGKMEEVSTNDGRTVLFVSHNMGAIKSLCNLAIILDKGSNIFIGNINDALVKYLTFDQTNLNDKLKYIRNIIPSSKIYVSEVMLVDDLDNDHFCLNLNVKIISLEFKRISINLRLKDNMGFPVGIGCTHILDPELYPIAQGENIIKIKSVELPLAIGTYKVSIELVIPGLVTLDLVDDCIEFEISNDTTAKRNYSIAQGWGSGSMEIKFEKMSKIES